MHLQLSLMCVHIAFTSIQRVSIVYIYSLQLLLASVQLYFWELQSMVYKLYKNYNNYYSVRNSQYFDGTLKDVNHYVFCTVNCEICNHGSMFSCVACANKNLSVVLLYPNSNLPILILHVSNIVS